MTFSAKSHQKPTESQSVTESVSTRFTRHDKVTDICLINEQVVCLINKQKNRIAFDSLSVASDSMKQHMSKTCFLLLDTMVLTYVAGREIPVYMRPKTESKANRNRTGTLTDTEKEKEKPPTPFAASGSVGSRVPKTNKTHSKDGLGVEEGSEGCFYLASGSSLHGFGWQSEVRVAGQKKERVKSNPTSSGEA